MVIQVGDADLFQFTACPVITIKSKYRLLSIVMTDELPVLVTFFTFCAVVYSTIKYEVTLKMHKKILLYTGS